MRTFLKAWILFLVVVFFTTGSTLKRYPQRRFSDYNEEKDANEQTTHDLLTELVTTDKPHCHQRNYEPLLTFGDFFFGRMTVTSERSLFGVYTKNGTILFCTISAFFCGIILGMTFSLCLGGGKRSSLPVHRSTSTTDLESFAEKSVSSEEERSSESHEQTRSGLEALHLDESSLHVDENRMGDELKDNVAWCHVETPVKEKAKGRSTAQSSKTHKTLRSTARKQKNTPAPRGKRNQASQASKQLNVERRDTVRLCGQLQELTETIRQTQGPLAAVIAATKGISTDVGVLKNVTHWMAWRKAKKDLWLQATDHMSYGILIMNVTLMLCAARYGRWQDWGLQCDMRYFHWSIHSLLSMLWCWVEEQFIFLLGCSMWWYTMRRAISSAFLKRQQPLSVLLVSLTLLCAGGLHSFTVALLGGSWIVSFAVWLFYSMFLVHVLESAKVSVPGGRAGMQPAMHPVLTLLIFNETIRTLLAVVVFPLMAGALPFWNVGLYLSLTSILQKYVQALVFRMHLAVNKFFEFLMY